MKSKPNQSPLSNFQQSNRHDGAIAMFRSIGRKVNQSPASTTPNPIIKQSNKQNKPNPQNKTDYTQHPKTNKSEMKMSVLSINKENKSGHDDHEEKKSRRKISNIRPTVALEQITFKERQRQHGNRNHENIQDNVNKLAVNINYLHSNKANHNTIFNTINEKRNKSMKKDCLHDPQSQIISEGLSKDGLFHVVSRVMSGEQLKKAVEYEYRMNAKGKKSQSIHKKGIESPHNVVLPEVQTSKTSSKENGVIKAYAVNTHQGISRKYNEDRVSIILNISKNGVKASYFAIYDGHGGSSCCDFLSQNLHQYILNSKKFPSHPRQALIDGIKSVEKKFLDITKKKFKARQQIDRSGSCVLIALIVGNQIFIANLGDSRAVLSTCRGKPLYSLSRDHKPTDLNQQARILKEGGKIYRTEMSKKQKKQDIIIGPLRVYPGKLSVTRTIGDIEAKEKELGGIDNCISTDPEICKYVISGKQDFIVLGCDGIYEKLDSEEVVEEIWKTINRNRGSENIHGISARATEAVIKQCMKKRSTDNLTVIMICLGNLGLNGENIEYRSI